MALFQIRSTLISFGLPCLNTLLFSRPARDLLSKLNRPYYIIMMKINNHPCKQRDYAYADVDIHNHISFLPTESMVAVQCKDAGLWIHGTVVEHRSGGHNGSNYRIRVIKRGCTITTTKNHAKSTPTIAEYYL